MLLNMSVFSFVKSVPVSEVVQQNATSKCFGEKSKSDSNPGSATS